MSTQWIRDDDEIGIEVQVSGETCFIPICTLHEPSLYHTTDGIMGLEANARLILAAPKLLDELKNCLALLTSEAATARIKGYEITDLRTWGHRVQQTIDSGRAIIRTAMGKETS